MDDSLPNDVDVVVLGTGLPEAVLAAACSRSGLSVLHLDTNDYYGADWASFNFNGINERFEQNDENDVSDLSEFEKFLEEGEKLRKIGNRKTIDNVDIQWDDEREGEEYKEQLRKDSRKFSIDLLPKILLAKGAMVQTLCDSKVSQYAEFKLVDRQLCPIVDESGEILLHQVPCSKGEIFTSNVLTMMEKRHLMKFITYVAQIKSKGDDEIIKEYKDKPFSEFLSSFGISGNLLSYIVNAIGILEQNPNAEKGIDAVFRFMDSVGHFGPSPFLVPLYGCGELAQCFCRLSAVFGSLYCLGRPLNAFVLKDDKIVAVIADGQRVNCQYVITSSKFVSDDVELTKSEFVQRRIFVTKRSLLEDEKERITLLNAASLRNSQATRIIEAGFEACVAPRGYYVVHVTATGDEELDQVTDQLFEQKEVHPLWRLRFDLVSHRSANGLPSNAILAPPVDASLGYSQVIEKCRDLFCKTWADRDFLPRAIEKDKDHELQEDQQQECTENEGSSTEKTETSIQ